MSLPIASLSTTAQLAQSLHLSTASVLIFTAIWSIESDHARDALRNASALVPCRSAIRLYEISWPPLQLDSRSSKLPELQTRRLPPHLTEVLQDLDINSNLLESFSFSDQLVHSNVTKAVPWLPCIQLYLNRSDGVTPLTYEDSFDQFSIASFLNQACDFASPPSFETPLPVPASVSLSERPNITLVSRDRFAHLLIANEGTRQCGMLVVLRGGTEALYRRYSQAWEDITFAINYSTTKAPKMWSNRISPWIVSIVNANVDTNFAQNIKFSERDSSPIWLVLVNSKRNDPYIIKSQTARGTFHNLAHSLDNFCFGKSKISKVFINTERISPSPRPTHDPKYIQDRMLSYFDEPINWRPYLSWPQSKAVLRDWMKNQYEHCQTQPSVLWAVIYQSWCAHCQRILGVYKLFAALLQQADVDVHLLFVEDCDNLPDWIDTAIDGFPTVLLFRQFNDWSSMEEYQAPHNLRCLIEYHDQATSLALHAQMESYSPP